MEELLKRHAQELREKATADFELHPATRRILQDEASRVYPSEIAKPSRKNFVWFWPRLAVAGVFTALFAVMLLQLNSPRNRSLPSVSSMRKAKDFSGAPVLEQPGEGPKRFFSAAADKAELSQISPATPPSSSLATRREFGAVGGVSGLATEANQAKQSSDDANRSITASSELDTLAATKSVPRGDTAENSSLPAPASTINPRQAAPDKSDTNALLPNRRQFVRQDLRASYRQNLLSPAQPKILETFELAQAGNKIQLIDSDGSVYEGEIVDASADVSSGSELKRKEPSRFGFRVSGKNLHLNQTVTFSGRLEETTKASTKDRSKISEEFKTGQTNRTLHGKISIGGTNEFEIQAIELPR